MSDITFTNSLGLAITLTTLELNQILSQLNAINSHYTRGRNQIAYIRIHATKLLIMDLSDKYNRTIFELFNIQYDLTQPFYIRFIHNNSALEFDISGAYLSIGYTKTTPIQQLSDVFMHLYEHDGQGYILAHDLVKHSGDFSIQPAELKNIIAGNGIKLFNDISTFTISSDLKNYEGTLTTNVLDVSNQQLYNLAGSSSIRVARLNNTINFSSIKYDASGNELNDPTKTPTPPTGLPTPLPPVALPFDPFSLFGLLGLGGLGGLGEDRTITNVIHNNSTYYVDGSTLIIKPKRQPQFLIENEFIYNTNRGYTKKQADVLLNQKQNMLPATDAITIQQVKNLQAALDMITPLENYDESDVIYLLDESNQMIYNLKDSDSIDVVKTNNSISFNIKRTDGLTTTGLPIIGAGIFTLPSIPSIPIPGGIPVLVSGAKYVINNILFSGFNYSVNGDVIMITNSKKKPNIYVNESFTYSGKTNVYTKSQIDTTINGINTQIGQVINVMGIMASNRYTKDETYNRNEVDNKIAALVDSAPATLDTLNELAAALNDDANFSTTITNLISYKANSTDVYTKTQADTLLANKQIFDTQIRHQITYEGGNVISYVNSNVGVHVGMYDTHASINLIPADSSSRGGLFFTKPNLPNGSLWSGWMYYNFSEHCYYFRCNSDFNYKFKISSTGDCEASNSLKAPIIYLGTSSLANLLNEKQGLITDGSLTIARTSGLQTALSDLANGKADVLTTYSKTETDELLTGKANTASPSFTGTVSFIDATSVSGLTKSTIGLSSVDNTSDANKPVSSATQTALNLKASLASPSFTGTVSFTGATSVSGLTKSTIGLSSVDNTSDANKPVSSATQSALNLKANSASPTFTGTVSGITKSMISLANVDNTSDVNKPISTATQTALDLKANLASPTFTGTITASNITSSGVSISSGVMTIPSTPVGLYCGLVDIHPTVHCVAAGNTTQRGGMLFSVSGGSGLANTWAGWMYYNFSDNAYYFRTGSSSTTKFKLDNTGNGTFAGDITAVNATFTGTVSGITKTMIGLGNVDNTADSAKTFAISQITNLQNSLTGKISSNSSTTLTGLTVNTSGVASSINTFMNGTDSATIVPVIFGGDGITPIPYPNLTFVNDSSKDSVSWQSALDFKMSNNTSTIPGRLMFKHSLNTFQVQVTSGGTTRDVFINNTGIGINRSSISYSLHLNADSAGKPSTSTWTVSSDERLKEDIELADLNICYDNIKNIPLKYYKWKDDVYNEDEVKDRHKLGWIAQDVKNVFPKAVDVKDMHGLTDCLNLNVDQLYASMYGTIQKLQQIVEAQDLRIQQLEQHILSN